MSTAKSLSFENRFRDELTEIVTEPCEILPLDEQVSLSDTGTFLSLKLTLAQFTELYSAIRIGAGIIYPDTFRQIEINFLQMVTCMTLCEQIIADCMTDAEFMQALSDALLPYGIGGGGGIGTNVPIPAINNSDVSGLSPGCSTSEQYGVAYALVDAFHVMATDMFEVIEVLTNDLELAGELIDNIPGLNIVVGLVVDVGNWVQDTIGENYASSYTVTTHEEIACQIYCFTQGTCQITIDDLRTSYRFFLEAFNPPSQGSPLADYLDWLIAVTSGISTVQFVALIHLMILEFIVRGSTFFGGSIRLLEIAGQTSTPITPPMSCTCDNFQCQVFDFTISEYSTYWQSHTGVPGNQALWVSGSGWTTNAVNNRITIKTKAAWSTNIDIYRVDIQISSPLLGDARQERLQRNNFATTIATITDPELEQRIDAFWTDNEMQIDLLGNAAVTPPNQLAGIYLEKVTIYYVHASEVFSGVPSC